MVFPIVIRVLQGMWKWLQRHANAEAGNASIQFALIGSTFLLVLMAVFEIAYAMIVGVLLEGAAREASRYGLTGQEVQNQTRLEVIRDVIEDHTNGFVDMATLSIEPKIYQSYDSIGKPEPFQDDNLNGTWDPGESYTDVNGNNQWDEDQGESGAGAGGDIIVYTLNYPQPVITPIMRGVFGTNGFIQRQARIVIKNEPF